jgi:hypothetical protein
LFETIELVTSITHSGHRILSEIKLQALCCDVHELMLCYMVC